MWLLLLHACDTTPPGDKPASAQCTSGEVLFGQPSEATGLSEAQCQPRCQDCGGEPWGPPSYGSADFAAWRAWILLDPPPALTEDPYAGPDPAPIDDVVVCAVATEADGTYRLVQHPDAAAAQAAGHAVTHFGVCGLCSTLADLAVYASTPDLTEPVRACGLAHFSDPIESLTDCIEGLGFTHACATIWAYNSRNTQTACLTECLAALDAPYHEPDGSLNPCLQCDEDQSGAVFSAVAGRTRRNTGLASTMCRPCDEVRPLEHGY